MVYSFGCKRLLVYVCCHLCRFGRMPTYLISTAAFIGATLGCVFSPTAEVLVLFRALQGAAGKTALTQLHCCVVLTQLNA